VQVKRKKENKVLKAVAAGVLVWLASSAAQYALIPMDLMLLSRHLIANTIGGLVAVVVTLTLQLRQEEVHFQAAMDRAAIVAELNHHVRNAIFPMHIAVQRLGDSDANKIADDAVERINIALKDATTDALSRRVDYSSNTGVDDAQA
jgi:hypothetical protein